MVKAQILDMQETNTIKKSILHFRKDIASCAEHFWVTEFFCYLIEISYKTKKAYESELS